MNSFLHWFVIIVSVGSFLGCWWLIKWTSKPKSGEAKTGDVTGHTWDGDLAEYNNPLPRWWLWLFYISIVFGLVYFALYPSMGNYAGYLGWSQEKRYEDEIKAANDKYGPIFKAYAATPIPELAKDPKALKVGQRLFLNYCSTCHGSDAGGASGFPSLKDNDWLHGGTPEAIKTSILDGRMGIMPAGMASGKDVEDVANYVLSLSGGPADKTKAEAGKDKFAVVCSGCHGVDAKGMTVTGAPNLTDDIWLYGGSLGAIKKAINNGRNGKMPPHKNFLGEDKVHLLAAYVYSLSAK